MTQQHEDPAPAHDGQPSHGPATWAWTVEQVQSGELYPVRMGPSAGGVQAQAEDDGPPMLMVDGYGAPGEGMTLDPASARQLVRDLTEVLDRMGDD